MVRTFEILYLDIYVFLLSPAAADQVTCPCKVIFAVEKTLHSGQIIGEQKIQFNQLQRDSTTSFLYFIFLARCFKNHTQTNSFESENEIWSNEYACFCSITPHTGEVLTEGT